MAVFDKYLCYFVSNTVKNIPFNQSDYYWESVSIFNNNKKNVAITVDGRNPAPADM